MLKKAITLMLFCCLLPFGLSMLSCRIEYCRPCRQYYPSGEVMKESVIFDRAGTYLTIYLYQSGMVKSHLYFKNHRLHGKQSTYFENGTVHSLQGFRNGLRHGLTDYYYLSGRLADRHHFIDGKIQYPMTGYFESGKIRDVITGNGGHSVLESFYETGEVLAKIVLLDKFNYESVLFFDRNGKYLNGRREIYYESGNLRMKGRFLNGKPDSLLVSYFESGAVESESVYRRGKPHGITKEYCENGLLESEIPYVSGTVHGTAKFYRIFYDDQIKTVRFVNGKLQKRP